MAARKTPVGVGRVPVHARRVADPHRVFVVISTAWSFAPWGSRSSVGPSLVPHAGHLGDRREHGGAGGRAALGQRVCLVIGAVMILGTTCSIRSGRSPAASSTSVIHLGGLARADGHRHRAVLVAFVYPLVPWPGVMLLGTGRRRCSRSRLRGGMRGSSPGGVQRSAAFVAAARVRRLRRPQSVARAGTARSRTIIDFLNVTKYPPSLLFLLMTLGPAAILCAFADRVPDAVRRPLIVFGRVPFAFYRWPHLYLTHAPAACISVSFTTSMPGSSCT